MPPSDRSETKLCRGSLGVQLAASTPTAELSLYLSRWSSVHRTGRWTDPWPAAGGGCGDKLAGAAPSGVVRHQVFDIAAAPSPGSAPNGVLC